MAALRLLLFFLVMTAGCRGIFSYTDPRDVAVLLSLKDQWQNTPPSWGKSDDPCGFPWEGVSCNNNSRVTELRLSAMGLSGKLSGDIGGLTELMAMDLSFNRGLTGPLSPRIGDLQNLSILILTGCSFNGNIPSELGNLAQLSFLALNLNNFTGEIPPSLGKLSNLYCLDIADNQLTGSIPISSSLTEAPGLDLLKKAQHFHFNNNQLSGQIPGTLFSSEMVLIHVLFNGNNLTGGIPSTLGYVQKLEVLRLDRNALTGNVPLSFNNLTNLTELHLEHNQLSGPFPDLTGMKALNYVDLSNNSFQQSQAPHWFGILESLTTLVAEYGSLEGTVPQRLFALPQIQQVKLRNNAFNETPGMGRAIGQQLKVVDLENNEITLATLGSGYDNTPILLAGNPVCNAVLAKISYCEDKRPFPPYSTSLANCASKSCPADKKLSPQSCECAHPYEGIMYFRAPSFRELSNYTLFQQLEMSLWTKLNLTPGSVSLQNPFFNVDDLLQVHLAFFPSVGEYFNRSAVQRMGFALNYYIFMPPGQFGSYYFTPFPYPFGAERRNAISKTIVTAIAACSVILGLLLICLGIYAVRQKRRAERAVELSKPFASWAPSRKDSGGAPQLKGARWFSYDELKKSTNNFSEKNEIGSGGYGKVYRGMLPSGLFVAIKRSQQGSKQGGHEFKTEIELLSRVHHKNLVGLVGFCFEQGEQMLVYEFMPNGTLRESLSGKSGIYLDWKMRLRAALGSARGLTYLHELAIPPIIHRDINTRNILLDENLTARVADFGLSKLGSDSSKGHVSTQVKGTPGYIDPEYYMTQKLTNKSDVYSFGVVMLELITAKLPIEKGKHIVHEVRMAMDKNDEECYGLGNMMDPAIRNATNLVGFVRFVDLAMQCVEESAADRPTMSELVKQLETIILQNDGLDTNSTSASSMTPPSATDFGMTKASGNKEIREKDLENSGESLPSTDFSRL